MPDGAASFDVISVVRRRRRWTSEQKLALVQEIEQPGSSLAAVADRRGVSRSLLFEWRRQLRDGTMSGITHADALAPLSGFAPVRMIADASMAASAERGSRPRRPTARSPTSVPIIELVLRNGRVLRVAETIAPETLGRLAAALEA